MKSTLAKIESAAEKIAKDNGLKVTTVMRDEKAFRVDFEEVDSKEERKAGFA